MIAWIAANWLTIVVGLVVLALIAVCLYNILPRKGKPAACAGCSGCAGCSASGGCPGCTGCK